MLRFLIYFLYFDYLRGQFVPTELKFDHPYLNQTTIGKLIPNLYELPAVNDTRPFAVRVVLASRDVTESDKISLQIKRGESDLQALLPRIQTFGGISKNYWYLAETLCEKRNLVEGPLTEFNDTVRISVSSGLPVLFDLLVKKVHGFAIDFKSRKIALSPPEPCFFRFSFSKGVDQIAVRITSTDDICGRITILKAGCPVFDNEGQIVLYDNYKHQTITKKGYMIIPRDMFGDDIHIVFSVLPIDEPCRSRDTSNALFDNPFRIKNVTADIKPFEPNYGASILAVTLVLLLFLIVLFVVFCSLDPNQNPEDTPFEGTLLFWTFSLAQIYVVVPLALVIVLLRATDSYQSSDTDTCNFNFECAIPFKFILAFDAFNNIISAATIMVVGLANHCFAWKVGRWRRMFPLNAWIFITGFFWTVMNKCPQEHTYYLYSIAMIMTVVQAKLLLFEKRNGRNIDNYISIGLISMLMIVWNIIDNNSDSTIGHWILSAFVFLTELSYVVHTSYTHGLWRAFSINEEHRIHLELEKLKRKSLTEQEQNQEDGFIEINAPRPTNVVEIQEIPTLTVGNESEQNPDPSSSVQIEIETANASATDPSIHENQDSLQTTSDTEPLIREKKVFTTKLFKKLYFAAAVLNIVLWTVLSALWMNSTTALLRFLQCDFVIYFMVYLGNKLNSPNDSQMKNPFWFWVLLVLNAIGIIGWGYISAFLLPAHVPFSPAESRALNTPCIDFGFSIGMDWHDLLHFLTAGIFVIFPRMVFVLDLQLRVIEPASEII